MKHLFDVVLPHLSMRNLFGALGYVAVGFGFGFVDGVKCGVEVVRYERSRKDPGT